MFSLHRVRRRRKAFGIGLSVLMTVAVAVAFLAAAASADVTNQPALLNGTTNAGGTLISVSPTTNLTDGQVITISADATASSGVTFNELRAHICQNNIGTVNSGKFSFAGPSCFSGVDAVPAGSHLGGNTAATTGDYETFQQYNAVSKTGVNDANNQPIPNLTFKAGTGTVTWLDETNQASHTLTCNVNNTCTLVIQVSGSEGLSYLKVPLSYAAPAAPSAPTLVSAASNQNAQSTLTWTAPSTGVVDSYLIHTTVGPNPPADFSVSGSTLTTVVPNLTNFSQYTFTVSAVNLGGSTASNSLNATPKPPAPGAPVAQQGAPSTVDLVSWTAPAGPSVPDSYRITVYIGAAAQPNPIDTGTTATSATVSNLTPGTVYTFTVTAHYATTSGDFGPESAHSNTVAPLSNALITQTITVTRPAGGLVLTQACAGSDPYPDTLATGPVGDISDVQYPTNCAVALGTATLVKTGPDAGQYFEAHGTMQPVTVVDTRDGDSGWGANGVVSDFTATGKSFSGNDLYWSPSVLSKSAPFTSPDGSYRMVVTPGASSTPNPPAVGGSASGSGLHSSSPLAVAPAHSGTETPGGPEVTGGLGIAQLGGPLDLYIPIFAKAGTYTAILTITVL